ncbi:hypothetical protein TRFO_15015 [Tritrichomonas foetus]|uniref:UBX domain-containing protein n=1 Tax=Tritrichomonas foetus TaxID=1144522 RepID=A0A1J4KUN2_9EUKA|nr:hypothetical protein TRFO_15015 [Tritrichomonas foetus]|eukprot:OHT14600.1 hypothetical protein TRFO_15015 [Tritrichomonas foetus]
MLDARNDFCNILIAHGITRQEIQRMNDVEFQLTLNSILDENSNSNFSHQNYENDYFEDDTQYQTHQPPARQPSRPRTTSNRQNVRHGPVAFDEEFGNGEYDEDEAVRLAIEKSLDDQLIPPHLRPKPSPADEVGYRSPQMSRYNRNSSVTRGQSNNTHTTTNNARNTRNNLYSNFGGYGENDGEYLPRPNPEPTPLPSYNAAAPTLSNRNKRTTRTNNNTNRTPTSGRSGATPRGATNTRRQTNITAVGATHTDSRSRQTNAISNSGSAGRRQESVSGHPAPRHTTTNTTATERAAQRRPSGTNANANPTRAASKRGGAIGDVSDLLVNGSLGGVSGSRGTANRGGHPTTSNPTSKKKVNVTKTTSTTSKPPSARGTTRGTTTTKTTSRQKQPSRGGGIGTRATPQTFVELSSKIDEIGRRLDEAETFLHDDFDPSADFEAPVIPSPARRHSNTRIPSSQNSFAQPPPPNHPAPRSQANQPPTSTSGSVASRSNSNNRPNSNSNTQPNSNSNNTVTSRPPSERQLSESQAIRNIQDLEFEQAQQEARMKEAEEAARLRREEEARLAEEAAKESRADEVRRLFAALPPEPAKGTTIAVTMPSGARSIRKFDPSAAGSTVYAWVAGQTIEFSEEERLFMDSFELQPMGQPMAGPLEKDKPLNEQGVSGRIMLAITVL